MIKQAIIPVNTLSVLLHQSARATEDEYESELAFRVGSRAEESAHAIHVKDCFWKLFNITKYGLQVLVTRCFESDSVEEYPYQVKLETRFEEGRFMTATCIGFDNADERNQHFWNLNEEEAVKFLESVNIIKPK